ncbi:MAG: hypothetical protein HZA88_16530 [Verrucomicrobia bacterium]|nr:hypothetical protein [Verrucomicrobiota bacterium]
MSIITHGMPKTNNRGRGPEMCESELWLRFQIESLCNVARIELERLETTLKESGLLTDSEAQRKTLKIAAEFDAAVSAWIDRWARWMNAASVPPEIAKSISRISDKILTTLRLVAGES